jgi:hypothetical protein
MSVSSLTTLGAIRDLRAPTKSDVGKTTDTASTEKPSLGDLLVTAVPTELVAPYTALMAAIVGSVDKPTTKVPKPDQLEAYRWAAFALLAVGVAVVVWRGKVKKAGRRRRKPVLEVGVALMAAVGWALALPESPLAPYLNDKLQTFVPLFVAFAATIGIAALGVNLQKKAKK